MLEFFCVQTKECCNNNFVVQLLHLLRVKGPHFFLVVLQEAKKIQKILKSTLRMPVINFRSFDPLILGIKRNTELAQSQNMCTTPTDTFLRKIEQKSDILLISLKSGCSDL